MPARSSTKIIIKPRKARVSVPQPMEEEEVATSDADNQKEEEEEPESPLASTSAQTPLAEDYDGVDVQTPEADDGGSHDGDSNVGDEDGDDAAPAKRKRGRPAGRGKSLAAGMSTPKAKGRGRPRGRPRAKNPITIRLPKRTEEPQEEAQGSGEEVQVEAEEQPQQQSQEQEGGEGPIAGGKPFRRINGKVYVIEGDEYVIDDDPKGDTKVDANGNLLGGRVYKNTTFVLPNRHPERLYMLAIDAARASGFRDSLYYFRRNPLALKLNATQAEKEYLIEVGKLGSHLRTRSVTMITARSAYKLHGAKMVVDGRWVVDDYYEDRALQDATAKGFKPGDLVVEPVDTSAGAVADAALRQAEQAKPERGAGLGLYRAGGPTTIFGGSGWGPYSDGPLNAVRKSMLHRDGLDEENWMLVAAQRTVEASAEWQRLRKEALRACGGIMEGVPVVEERMSAEKRARGSEDVMEGAEESARARGKRRKIWDEGLLPLGVYEPHTGIVFYRSDTQPSRARWESLPDDAEKRRVLGGTKAGSGAWGVAWVDTVMKLPREEEIDFEGRIARAPFLHTTSEPS